MIRFGRILALAGFMLGSGEAISTGSPTPEGDWIGWHCRPTTGFPSCTLQRVGLQNHVLATASPVDAGNQPGPLTLSRDGQILYSAGTQLHAWDAHTLKVQWTTPVVTPDRFTGREISPLALSPDGRSLAVAGSGPGEVKVRDAASGRVQQTIAHPRASQATQDTAWSLTVTALAYDPTGRFLAIGSRVGGLRLHDLVTGQERRLTGRCGQVSPPFVTAHRGAVDALVWTGPTTLVSTANDETMRRWETTTGRETACLSIPGGIRGLQALSGGRLLALSATSATLVDGRTFQRVARLGPLTRALSELSVLDHTVRLSDTLQDRSWNLETGQEIDLHGPPLATSTQQGVQVQVGPDMRVTVVRNGHTQTLSPPAVPPSNFDGSGFPDGWRLELSGPVLTVTAKSSISTGIMDTAEVLNIYRWNLPTGRLERCDTTGTAGTWRDRACPGPRQPR